MAMDVWVPLRNKDVEMVVFGDGGGFVRLYEIRINPLVSVRKKERRNGFALWFIGLEGTSLILACALFSALSQVP